METTNIVLITSMIFLNCVIPSEPPKETFKMYLCVDDTISPYSSIIIGFSSPIQDSQQINFHFDPLFLDYICEVNETKDTIEIIPSSPLKGNTRYKFHSENPLNSTEQSVITTTDTLSFRTYPHEREPNNSIQTADILTGKAFGSVSNVNDTDVFSISNKKASGLYLKSESSQSIFSISDSTGKLIQKSKYRSMDSIMIPDSFAYPVYMQVYSYYRSNGGNYEIGLLTK